MKVIIIFLPVVLKTGTHLNEQTENADGMENHWHHRECVVE